MPKWQVALITIGAVFAFAGLCAVLGIIYVNFFTWRAAYQGYRQFDMAENEKRNKWDRELFERTGGKIVRTEAPKKRGSKDKDKIVDGKDKDRESNGRSPRKDGSDEYDDRERDRDRYRERDRDRRDRDRDRDEDYDNYRERDRDDYNHESERDRDRDRGRYYGSTDDKDYRDEERGEGGGRGHTNDWEMEDRGKRGGRRGERSDEDELI